MAVVIEVPDSPAPASDAGGGGTARIPPFTAWGLHDHPVPLTRVRGSYACACCLQLRYEEAHQCMTCGRGDGANPAGSSGGSFVGAPAAAATAPVRFCLDCYAREAALMAECLAEAQRNVDAARRATAAAAAASAPGRGESPDGGGGGLADPDGVTPFLRACLDGDVEGLRSILDRSEFMTGLDVEAKPSHGRYAGKNGLLLAAERGHAAIVALLLHRAHVNPEAIDDRGMTGLMLAAHEGHVNVADELLFAGASVDRVAFCGYTAMLFAANRGHDKVLRRLVAAGASLLARTPRSRNALLVAAFNGHLQVVKTLLAMPGCEVDATDNEGYTARDAALANAFPAVEKVLAAAEADLVAV